MQAALLLMALTAAQAKPAVPDTLRKDETPPPRVRERRPDAVLHWNSVALDLIRVERTPPPMVARHLAMLHAAIADAVNTIYQTHRPYYVALRATEPIDPDATVAAAAHRLLTDFYPRQTRRIDRERDLALITVRTGTARNRGLTLGKYVAERMLAWRRTDGSNLKREYRASPGVGNWQPTLPRFDAPLYPHWGGVTPFGITDTSKFRPSPPPPLASTEYTEVFDEVKTLGGLNSAKRTADQSIIAWFWEGGAGTCTPPGQWNLIAQEAALEHGNSLPENARLFALLNIALADAGIACWDCKFRFSYWRPITAIRLADRTSNLDTKPDARWQPLLHTPPFPSYTSGHSTFSGAGATILAKFFGTDQMPFSTASDSIPGTIRSYKSFWEAALEAGKSRIYGGIHYECDNRAGLAVGKAVAEEVFRTRLHPEDASITRSSEARRAKQDGSPRITRRERP
jgi:hypothetical protein